MKKIVLTSALFMTFASATAFAHHPAADNVDPEIYAMIDENVSDTPHADLTFDDMGSGMDAAGSAMQAMEDASEATESGRGAMSDAAQENMDSRMDTDVAMQAEDALETIDLFENVSSALAD